MLSSFVLKAQTRYGEKLSFTNPDKNALEYIAAEFDSRVLSQDTICLFAVGSVRFTVSKDGVDQVDVCAGLPYYIANPLKEAVLASTTYWKLGKRAKSVTVLIPVLIGPANRCKEHTDDIVNFSANMLNYEKPYIRTPISLYNKNAIGAMEALILPPLLLKSWIVS